MKVNQPMDAPTPT